MATKSFLCLSAMLQVSCLKATNVIDDLWLKLADVVQTGRHENCPQTSVRKDVGIYTALLLYFPFGPCQRLHADVNKAL